MQTFFLIKTSLIYDNFNEGFTSQYPGTERLTLRGYLAIFLSFNDNLLGLITYYCWCFSLYGWIQPMRIFAGKESERTCERTGVG